MTKMQLDKEEQALSDAFDVGEFESDLSDKRKTLLSQTATASQKKDKRINIRLSSRDLFAIQRRAIKEGLPYQTLVSSILHKYASGSLQEIAPK
ncbi:MAG: CopG family antitoxin [Methylophagaceae bacterium]